MSQTMHASKVSKSRWLKLWFLILFGAQKSAVLYLLIFLLGTRIFDIDKIHVRILNSLLVPIDYLYELSMGEETFNKETFSAYLDYYKQFIKYSVYSADVLGMLGFCYSYMGDQPRAIGLYKEAIAQEPTFFWFHYNLGVIYFKQGQYSEAVTSFKRALSVDRKTTLTLASNSHILIYFGSSDKVDFPVKKTPTQEEVYLDMAKHLREGMRHCQEMIILSYFRMKEYSKMLKWVQTGIDHLEGDISFFYFYGGVAAYQLKNYSAALLFLNNCIEKDPGYAEAYYYLHLTLKAMEKNDQAIPPLMVYESLRALHPQERLIDQKKYHLMVF